MTDTLLTVTDQEEALSRAYASLWRRVQDILRPCTQKIEMVLTFASRLVEGCVPLSNCN